jgi:hypothetical protein
MKITLILLLSLFLEHTALCQDIYLSGKAMYDHNIPMDYAVVMLCREDSIIRTELTEENGSFTMNNLSQGSYMLIVEQLGVKLYSRSIELAGNMDLGTINITKTMELQTVTITGKKPLIARKTDRLVFNVENSTAAIGGDALEALKITPGIRVQNGQITMIGRSNMNVMLNERPVQLTGDDLINFIRNIPAGEIQRIEVITNPTAKYDAEGNSGLVNIVTKKAKLNSLGGSITTALSKSKGYIGNEGFNLNFQKDGLTFSSSISYSNGTIQPYQKYTLFYPNYLWQEENNKKNYINNLGGRFTIEYKLNSKIKMGGEYSTSNNLPLAKVNNSSFIYNKSNVLDSIIINESRIEADRKTNSFNFYTIMELDTATGKKINFDMDYTNYQSGINNSFYSNTLHKDERMNFFSANNFSNLNIDILTSKVDVEYPTRWINLNFGAKLTFINNNSDVSFYNTTSGNSVIDPLQTNEFRYKENMQALYVSGTKQLTGNLEIQLGLRGENTQTTGHSKTLDKIDRKRYFKLFPSVFLNYMFSEDKIVSFNYNRRINRPSYNNLNPFRFYSTTFNYAEGNPFLQPYFSDNLEWSCTYKNSYISLNFNYINNRYDEVTYVQPNSAIQVIKPENFYNQMNYGLFYGYYFNIRNFWESSNDIYAFHSQVQSKIPDIIPNISAWSGSITTNNTFMIDKGGKYKAELNFLYQFPSLAGSYELSEFYQLDMGFRTHFFNNKLQFSLTVLDVFKTNKKTFTQVVNKIRQENYDYADIRRIRFSLVYNFGNQFKMKKRNNSNEDEKRRIK